MKNLFGKSVLGLVSLLFIQTALFAQDDNTSKKEENNTPKKEKVNEIGISSSTNMNIGLTYKYGSSKIYGLIQTGTSYTEIEAFILGIGIGTSFNFNQYSKLKLEGTYLSYFFDDFNESGLDKGFHISCLYERNINDRFKFNIGPSVGITENNSGTGFDNKTMIPPIAKFDMGNTETGLIIGLGAGIMYNF